MISLRYHLFTSIYPFLLVLIFKERRERDERRGGLLGIVVAAAGVPREDQFAGGARDAHVQQAQAFFRVIATRFLVAMPSR